MNGKNPWKSRAARFVAAQAVSLFGSSLVQYAIIWHITLTTSSGKMLAISTLCGFLPQLAVSVFGGVWADRFSRKSLIMLADGAVAEGMSRAQGYREMWLMFGVLAVRSAGTGFQTPAVQAFLPQIVPKEKLMRVGGVQSSVNSAITFLSPALGGALLSLYPLETVLLVDIVTAIVGISLTAGIKAGEQKRDAAVSGWKSLQEGFAYARQNRVLRNLLAFQVLTMFLISPSAFLTPLLVERAFGGEVWRLTASEMTYSAGMVLGGALIAAWGGFSKKLRTTLLAGGIYGLLMLGLGLSPVFLGYLACNLLIGATSPCYHTPMNVYLQENTAPEMQGRVFGLMQAVSSCALPLGMALFGPLADIVPISVLFVVCGILTAGTAAFTFRRRLLD